MPKHEGKRVGKDGAIRHVVVTHLVMRSRTGPGAIRVVFLD